MSKRYSNKESVRMAEVLRFIRDFPPESYPRRTDDGYPSEVAYDEFAYKRIVDTYRNWARQGLREEILGDDE